MASITIRDLPDSTKEKLRVQAAQSGISLESHARSILQSAALGKQATPVDVVEMAREYFGIRNGIDLELPERQSNRNTPEFSG